MVYMKLLLTVNSANQFSAELGSLQICLPVLLNYFRVLLLCTEKVSSLYLFSASLHQCYLLQSKLKNKYIKWKFQFKLFKVDWGKKLVSLQL